MTFSIAIVCEAPADRATAIALAERLLMESAEWIVPENVGEHIEWRGFRKADSHLTWTQAKRLATELAIIARYKGFPRHPYSQQALRAIRVLAASPDRIDGMILMADSDGDLGRLDGLRQGREQNEHAHLPILIALPHTKRECWHIAGYEPTDEAERARTVSLREELGFDPRLESHELTAGHDENNDKRSAKRVLSALTHGDGVREAECLGAPFALLEARGRMNGLADFLGELRTRLIRVHFNPALRHGQE